MLLTGATGFVGSQVARVLLASGWEVHVLIRPGSSPERIADVLDDLSVIEGDVASMADPARLTRISPDLCLHLAWYAEPGRYLHARAENLACLRTGLDFVQALATAGCPRLVIAGSCAEFGPTSEDSVFDESAPPRPTTAYARAKTALFLAAQDAASLGGMEFAWARLFFLYGPWEQPARVVPAAVRACLRQEAFPATLGEQVRDYLHVSDAAAALWAVARSGLLGPVNICSGEATTLRSVLEEIEQATDAQGMIRYGEKQYLPGEWMWMRGSNQRLSSTGWEPGRTLAEGIAQTVDWWRSQAVTLR